MIKMMSISEEPRSSSTPRVRINRLSSVEEELTDRILRESDGRRVIGLCRELAGNLLPVYDEDPEGLEALKEQLCLVLVQERKYERQQAKALIELSLDLVHARLYKNYRRSNVELGFLVATATGAVVDLSSN